MKRVVAIAGAGVPGDPRRCGVLPEGVYSHVLSYEDVPAKVPWGPLRQPRFVMHSYRLAKRSPEDPQRAPGTPIERGEVPAECSAGSAGLARLCELWEQVSGCELTFGDMRTLVPKRTLGSAGSL